jgi:hypothetical protein
MNGNGMDKGFHSLACSELRQSACKGEGAGFEFGYGDRKPNPAMRIYTA